MERRPETSKAETVKKITIKEKKEENMGNKRKKGRKSK